jgi:hypothetical protein
MEKMEEQIMIWTLAKSNLIRLIIVDDDDDDDVEHNGRTVYGINCF